MNSLLIYIIPKYSYTYTYFIIDCYLLFFKKKKKKKKNIFWNKINIYKQIQIYWFVKMSFN